MTLLRILSTAVGDYRRHACSTVSASVAYFSLLSLFPLGFLLLYVASLVVGRDQVSYDFLVNSLRVFVPTFSAELASGIQRITADGHVEWIILVTLGWCGLLVFREVQHALDVVFDTPRARHPLVSTAFSAARLACLALLMALSYVLT